MNSTILSQSLEIIEKNEDILAAIVENLQIGRIDDCMKHYSILQANLISLATELDNFPAGSFDPYKKLTEFPDLIMRKDICDDLQPLGFKSLLEPPLIPACSDCAKQQISSEICREKLAHVDVHHKFTQIERQEFYCATQVLSTKHSKFSEDVGTRKKPRNYKRWAAHEKMFENTRSESQIRCYVIKQLKLNEKGRLDISLQDLLAQKPVGYQPPPVLALHFANNATTVEDESNSTIAGKSILSIDLINPITIATTTTTNAVNTTTNNATATTINTATTTANNITPAITSGIAVPVTKTHPPPPYPLKASSAAFLYPNEISHINEFAQFESNVTNSLIAPKPGSCEWDILVAIAADLQIRNLSDSTITIATTATDNTRLTTAVGTSVPTINIPPQELHSGVPLKKNILPLPPNNNHPQQQQQHLVTSSSSLHPHHMNNPIPSNRTLSILHPQYHHIIPPTATAATVYASSMANHTYPSTHYNNSNAHHLMHYPQQMAANPMVYMQHHPPLPFLPHHPALFQKEHPAFQTSPNTILAAATHTAHMMNPSQISLPIGMLEPIRPHQPPYLSASAQSNLIQQQQQQAQHVEMNSTSLNNISEAVFDVDKNSLSSKITLPSIAATSALLPPAPLEAPSNLRDPLKERISLENYLQEHYQYSASYYAMHIYPTVLKQQQQAAAINKSQKNRKAPPFAKPGINKLKQYKIESLAKNNVDNNQNLVNNDNNNNNNNNNNNDKILETKTTKTNDISNNINEIQTNNNNNSNQSLFNSVLIGDKKKKKKILTTDISDNNHTHTINNTTNNIIAITNLETIQKESVFNNNLLTNAMGFNNNQLSNAMDFNNNPENNYHISEELHTSAALEVSSSELLDEYSSNSLSYGASVMPDFDCEFSFL